MPATPGTSADVAVNPAVGSVNSVTWDPFVGIEAGRTYVGPSAPEEGKSTFKTTAK